MTRNRTLIRTVALATTALSLVLVGPAAADAASARFQAGKFRVELEGVQRTTWETHHVKQFDCDVNIDGHGTETVRFRSRPAVLTVSIFGDSTPVLLIGRKPAILDLRSRITRNGVLDTSGGAVCSDGDGTGGDPPPPDCGTKRSTLFAELTYDSQRPAVIGLERSLAMPLGPFHNCPSGGTSWPSLFDHHVETSRMIGQRLPARELFRHGKHIVIARGRERQSTPEDRSTTTIRWTLTLTRISATERKSYDSSIRQSLRRRSAGRLRRAGLRRREAHQVHGHDQRR